MPSVRRALLAPYNLLIALLLPACSSTSGVVGDGSDAGSGSQAGSAATSGGNGGGSSNAAGKGNVSGASSGAGNATSAGNANGGGTETGGGNMGGSTVGGAAGNGGSSAGNGGSADNGGNAGNAGIGGNAGSGGAPPNEPVTSQACTPGSGRKLYVSPNGSAQGDGKSVATAYDIQTARTAAMPGDTLLLQPGKYAVAYSEGAKNTLVFSQKGSAEQPIRVIAEGGRAELDFSFPEQAWVQDSYGLLVSGNYWSFCRLDITRAGYQGAYVTGQHNTFENCTFHDNRNTGLEINKGGAYTTVINCDAYRNYDPKKLGSMADGFGPKETQGPGNRFYGCRAWENSDDGYDAFESPEQVIFERSFAFRNGIDVWNYGGYSGNGNGFKIGGNAAQANHRLTQCAAFGNRVKGFDQNNNSGGITIHNSTAFGNATNFALGGALNAGQKHDLRNNASLGAANTIANALEQNNSWNLGLTLTSADFKSVDVALGSAPRAADGSLPASAFLQPAAGSKLIDAGVEVSLPFTGKAPDLGAFEAP